MSNGMLLLNGTFTEDKLAIEYYGVAELLVRYDRSGKLEFCIISIIDSYNDKPPHPFWFFLLFLSNRWSFGLEKKKNRTPKVLARDKKYSYVYSRVNTYVRFLKFHYFL